MADWKRELGKALSCGGLAALAVVIDGNAPVVAAGLMAAAFLAGGWSAAWEGFADLRRGRFDIDGLMVGAAVAAWAIGHPGEGAFLLALFSASRAMETYANGKTRGALEDLSRELPETATRVLDDEHEETVRVDDLEVGWLVKIAPGAAAPADVCVVTGRSEVDASAITGESDPVPIAPGSDIPSGAVNGNGLVIARVTKPASESAFQKILRLLQNSEAHQAPLQKFVAKVEQRYSIALVAASALAFGAWMAAGYATPEALYRALVLLVAGSPCALVLSAPTAIFAGVTAGARRGVVYHGGRGLLGLAGINEAVFDKTGTLTTGEPWVEAVSGSGADDSALLAVAAGLANSSTHPASRAVLAHVGGGETADLADVTERPGTGIEGCWRGHEVLLGRPNDACPPHEGPSVWLFVDGAPRVMFALAETLRPSARLTLDGLRGRGIGARVMSGDHPAAVARTLEGLDLCGAEGGLSPEDKHGRVAALRAGGARVLMVGDGVNDAPALAAADVSVVMGLGASAAALSQADAVLSRARPGDLLEAVDLSRRADAIVRQNVTLAVGAACLLVAGALTGGLPLGLAVLGHEGGSVLVSLNSLRLLRGQGNCSDGHLPCGPLAGVPGGGAAG